MAARRCDRAWAARIRRAAIAALALLMVAAVTRRASAQEPSSPQPPPGQEIPLEGWGLAGIDVDLRERWRTTIALGHLGGFDSRIVLTEVTFAADKAVQLVAGHVYLQPTAAGSPATSVLRVGGVWLPLRRRLSLDNRLLVERRSAHAAGVSTRVRDRLRMSWTLEQASRVCLFASVETFAEAGAGLAEHRYQAGVTRQLASIGIETYWLQRRSRTRAPFNAIGLTVLWRLRMPRAASAG